jgi:hypothetical protein
MVPCSTWYLRKCHFKPMCLVFSLIKAFSEYAMVVLLDGGGFGDGGVEDLSYKLPEIESLLGGVSRRLVLGFTRGLGHTSLLFGLVADGPASESKEIARTRLASVAVVCPVSVGKARELGTVVRAPPQRRSHVDGAMEVSKDLFESMQVCVRGGCLGGAEDAKRRGDIETFAYGRVLETAHEAWVEMLGHPGEGGEFMCARSARKPGSIGMDDGLESAMPYFARMSRRYLDWSLILNCTPS